MAAAEIKPRLKVAFAGTPQFAVPALRAMAEHDFTPAIVLTQPDRAAGRGRELRASPVKACAQSAGIPVFQPASLRGEDAAATLESLGLDLMIVVAYGLILPPGVLAIPRYGCWNIHASLLPRWRGAAPIQRCIEAGDSGTGVSIMQMAEGLDTGPVFLQVRTDLAPDETGGSLHDRLALLGADALLHCLDRLAVGAMPEPVGQDGSAATYARKLDKAEAELDWTQPAAVLERKIRAFNPWPVCWTDFEGERIRIWRAECCQARNPGVPGEILNGEKGSLEIATGEGALRLLEVQRPGGRRMAARDFLNARPGAPA